MRCPMCLGKGYATDEDIKEYPHRCPNCNGKGFYSVDWKQFRCEVCNGSGKKPQTNEEWIKSCTTEQLAEFLLKISEIDDAPIPCGDLMECSKNCGLYSQCAGDDVMPTNEEIWLEWLKQPHKE